MILAGIDEAGYGPLLGPLVVGCCAFGVEDRGGADGQPPDAAALPCLWTLLRRAVSKKKTAGGKLHINDSKIVYTPQAGLKQLERSVLALAAACHGGCEDLDALVRHAAGGAAAELAEYPWYQAAAGERFPLAQSASSIGIGANALGVEMRRQGVACVRLQARVLCERQFNSMLAATRNKANALFSITAVHLDRLLRDFGHQNLTIVCDRQGGRQHYGALLRLMFPDWSLQVIGEEEGRAEYYLCQGPHRVRLLILEKAETQCLATAAASMLSKYLREALMSRFNAFWTAHAPQAAPTAGYYTDGQRFLRDIAPQRRQLGIADEQLIRCR
jgi:hypothetical protein